MLSVTDRLGHPGNSLYGLVAQAKYLDATGKALANYLGPPISYHCRLAAIFSDTVILYVDSPVWYSKLRFFAPDIVEFFRTHCGLTTTGKVSIHVDPFLFRHAALRQEVPNEKYLRMSPNVAKLLRSVAHATADPVLREAWLRLSRNGPEPQK